MQKENLLGNITILYASLVNISIIPYAQWSVRHVLQPYQNTKAGLDCSRMPSGELRIAIRLVGSTICAAPVEPKVEESFSRLLCQRIDYS